MLRNNGGPRMLDMWKAEAMGSQRVQDSERLKKIRGE